MRSWLVATPAPAFYAVAFVAGILIDRALPWRPGWSQPLPWVGWLLLAIGVVLAPGSASLFGIRRTTLNPAGQPSRLVTQGTFRLSRNPMYLGLAVAYVGLALVFRQAWPFVTLTAPLALLNFLVIPFEEARMRDTFGDEYIAYCKRVRRWV